MILYLDTSSLVKLFVKEAHSKKVREWVDEAEIIVTCRVAYPETISALIFTILIVVTGPGLAKAGDIPEYGRPSLAPPLITDDEDYEYYDEGAAWWEITLEGVGDMTLGFVGFSAGAIIDVMGSCMSGRCPFDGDPEQWENVPSPGIDGFLVGSALGCGLGTVLAGKLLDRNGSGGYTMITATGLGITEMIILHTGWTSIFSRQTNLSHKVKVTNKAVQP